MPSPQTYKGRSHMSTKRSHLLRNAALIALSFAVPGSSATAFAQGNSNRPEGSWAFTVTIPGFGTFQGIETYADGGGYTEADQLSFSPFSVASAGHGAWTRTGENKFLLTYVNLTFDGFNTGKPTVTMKVRQAAKIDRTGNSYSGAGDFTYYDLNGNPIPSIS